MNYVYEAEISKVELESDLLWIDLVFIRYHQILSFVHHFGGFHLDRLRIMELKREIERVFDVNIKDLSRLRIEVVVTAAIGYSAYQTTASVGELIALRNSYDKREFNIRNWVTKMQVMERLVNE